MFQNRRRDAKIDGILIIHLCAYPVQYACSERITAADTIDDPSDGVGSRRMQTRARQQRARQIVIVHAALNSDRRRDTLQVRKSVERELAGDLELLRRRHAIKALSQDQADIALFREQQVRLFNQFPQNGARVAVPALPQFRAIVAVERDGDTE